MCSLNRFKPQTLHAVAKATIVSAFLIGSFKRETQDPIIVANLEPAAILFSTYLLAKQDETPTPAPEPRQYLEAAWNHSGRPSVIPLIKRDIRIHSARFSEIVYFMPLTVSGNSGVVLSAHFMTAKKVNLPKRVF